MDAAGRQVSAVVTACLQASGTRSRGVAPGEWGIVIDDVGGRPLEVGLRLRDGLLAVQAWVAPTGVLDPHLLLHRNRLHALARYAHSSAGEVHVHAEAFAEGLGVEDLDRLLGAVVEAAEVARASWAGGVPGGGVEGDGGGDAMAPVSARRRPARTAAASEAPHAITDGNERLGAPGAGVVPERHRPRRQADVGQAMRRGGTGR